MSRAFQCDECKCLFSGEPVWLGMRGMSGNSDHQLSREACIQSKLGTKRELCSGCTAKLLRSLADSLEPTPTGGQR